YRHGGLRCFTHQQAVNVVETENHARVIEALDLLAESVGRGINGPQNDTDERRIDLDPFDDFLHGSSVVQQLHRKIRRIDRHSSHVRDELLDKIGLNDGGSGGILIQNVLREPQILQIDLAVYRSNVSVDLAGGVCRDPINAKLSFVRKVIE